MLFKTNEAHEALRKKVREFAETVVAPVAFELDRENKFPEDIVAQMADLGIMGLPTAEEYGGGGGGATFFPM